jgi:hypothetical protein
MREKIREGGGVLSLRLKIIFRALIFFKAPRSHVPHRQKRLDGWRGAGKLMEGH